MPWTCVCFPKGQLKAVGSVFRGLSGVVSGRANRSPLAPSRFNVITLFQLLVWVCMSGFVRRVFYLAHDRFAGDLLEVFCSVPGQTLRFVLGFVIKLLLQGNSGSCHFDAWRGRGSGLERVAGRELEQMGVAGGGRALASAWGSSQR